VSTDKILAAIDDLASDEDMTPEERLSAIRAILQAHFTITDPATVFPYK
jgi:hypothetical protein